MQDRRAALGVVIGAASLMAARPSQAAYGEGANVFGRVTNKTGFVPYAGDNFAVLIPSKWNPSDEREVNSIVLRWVLVWRIPTFTWSMLCGLLVL